MPSQKDLPNTNWYYVGQDGETYGPNTALAMIDWCKNGYFKDNFLVRTEHDDRFYTLAEWIVSCGNQIPFHFPIASMNLLTGRDCGESMSPPNGAGSSSAGDDSPSSGTHLQRPFPHLQQFFMPHHYVTAPPPFVIIQPDQTQTPFVRVPNSGVHFPPPNMLMNSGDMLKCVSDTKWYYVGQDGETYGPNSASAMVDWLISGYFAESVLVRTENDERFYTLSEWIVNCGNQVPFLLPITSMNTLTASPAQSISILSDNNDDGSQVRRVPMSVTVSSPQQPNVLPSHHLIAPYVMVGGFSHPPPAVAPYIMSTSNSSSLIARNVLRTLENTAVAAPTIVTGGAPISMPVGVPVNASCIPQQFNTISFVHQPQQIYTNVQHLQQFHAELKPSSVAVVTPLVVPPSCQRVV